MLRVQVSSRLICNQNLRLTNHRTRDRYTLTLAARKLMRKMLFLPLKTNQLNNLRHSRLNFPICHSSNFQRKRHIFKHRSIRKQLKILKNHANFTTQQRNMLVLQIVIIDSANHNFSRARLFFASQKLQKSRFTSTRRTNNNHKLTSANMNACSIQCRLVTFSVVLRYPI